MKKLIWFLFCALLLTGCGSDKEDAGGTTQAWPQVQPRTKPPTTFSINLAEKPSSIDPTLATEVSAQKMLLGLFDPLVRLDKDCKPQPAAAKSWEHSDDYMIWTFHLRPEGKWHNGDPVTSADFKFAVERLLSPSNATFYVDVVKPLIKGGDEYYAAGGLDKGLHLDSVTTPDDLTVVYELAYPAPYFITFVQLFCFMPVHRQTVEAHGTNWSLEPSTYVGNGPFKLTGFRGRIYYAAKADTYWDKDNIFWENIEFYTTEDINTENSAFITGDLDVTEDVAVPEMPRWQPSPYYNSHPTLATYYVSFNTKRPPLDDVRVRKALSKAMDRELIVNRVTRRNEPISQGFVPGFLNSERGGTYGQARGDLIGSMDLDAAKALLAEAGYGPGAKVPSIEYVYNTDDVNKAIAEQLQFMWKEIGVQDVRLQNVEWGTLMNRARQHDFVALRSSWVGDYLDPMTFLEIFTTGNAKNAPQYNNPKYDELLAQARLEQDPVKREDLMIAAEKLLVEEDCAIAPIYSYVSPILVRDDIEGFERNLIGNFLYTHARRKSAGGNP